MSGVRRRRRRRPARGGYRRYARTVIFRVGRGTRRVRLENGGGGGGGREGKTSKERADRKIEDEEGVEEKY